jgi:ferredoxin
MCDFCHKHGEGKKWYLEAKNYSEDLLSDLRRRNFISHFFAQPEELKKATNSLDRLQRAPLFVRQVLTWGLTRRQKKVHYGQVVPIEDVEHILDFVTSVVRLTCVCRYTTVGPEQRYCYAVSLAPNGGRQMQIIREIDAGYLTGPDTKGLETLSKTEAIEAMHNHEQEGLCHTVWTFIAPFIGGICNCDRSDCLAMRATVKHQFPVMFRAEYVGSVHPDLCNGCRQCMRVCQFGAIGYSAATKKTAIDARRCYGCGICRAVCTKNAISLLDRASVSAAASLW